ncbi:equilibrative nucleoside transporter 1 isoform X3 [Bacillus rossius redtenbacheri]
MSSKTVQNSFLMTECPARNGSTPRSARKSAECCEKQPLFERTAATQPVRLTPAWEENNLPSDELNFKAVTMERADLEMNPPSDRLNLVYLTLLLHGIGTLLPWNMFITANDYFAKFKFSEEYTGRKLDYVTNFLNYLGFAAQVPSFLFNWLNIFVQIKGSLTTRIVWSISIEVLVFILTVILAMCDSSEWPDAFFWITIISFVILNMANGVYQNSVFGMAAKLPFKYTGVVILGTNVSGTFTAIINLFSSIMAPNARTAAIYYFITALFVLLACFDTYFALPLSRFYRYHELLYEKELQLKKRNNQNVLPTTPYFTILSQCLMQCFNVFFIFFVTLAIFPTMHASIKKYDENFFVSEALYANIMCFLTFNAFALIGSLLSTLGSWPQPKYMVVPVVARALFIPFFLLCNYVPANVERALPVLVTSDWAYWLGAVAMAVTSGYFSAVAMMYVSGSVEPQYAATAGMFGSAFLITGILAGVIFSLLMPGIATISWFQ